LELFLENPSDVLDSERMQGIFRRIRKDRRPSPFYFSWYSAVLDNLPVLLIGAYHRRKISRRLLQEHRHPKGIHGRVYSCCADVVFEVGQETDKGRLRRKLYEATVRYAAGIPINRILVLSPSDAKQADPLFSARQGREQEDKERIERIEKYMLKAQ
jgi:hypothetical protein